MTNPIDFEPKVTKIFNLKKPITVARILAVKPKCEQLAREMNKQKIVQIFPDTEFLRSLHHIEIYLGKAQIYFEKFDGCHSGLKWSMYMNLIGRALSMPALTESRYAMTVTKGKITSTHM